MAFHAEEGGIKYRWSKYTFSVGFPSRIVRRFTRKKTFCWPCTALDYYVEVIQI